MVKQDIGTSRAPKIQATSFEEVLATAKTDLSEIKKAACMQCFTREFERYQRVEKGTSPHTQKASIEAGDLETCDATEIQQAVRSANGESYFCHHVLISNLPVAETPSFVGEDACSAPAAPDAEQTIEQVMQNGSDEKPTESFSPDLEDGSMTTNKPDALGFGSVDTPKPHYASDDTLQAEVNSEANTEVPTDPPEASGEHTEGSELPKLLVPPPKITPQAREAVKQFGGARAFLTSRA